MRFPKSVARSWIFRSMLVLPLIIGLGAGLTAALPAAAASNGVIDVYAPGAAAGAPVDVQWQDPSGNWLAVTGWKAHLDTLDNGVPFKQWSVFPANYGQGLFRWIVFDADGTTVFGISDTFNLPTADGQTVAKTVVAGMNMAAGATTTSMPTTPAATPAPTTPSTTPSTPAPSSLLFTNTGMALFHLNCSDCSAISGYFLGVPATAWITVQWGDGQGHYFTVPGWEGVADDTDSTTGQLIKHFTFGSANLGQGPFRWAVYDMQGGTLLGYSADFTLPTGIAQNLFMSFSK